MSQPEIGAARPTMPLEEVMVDGVYTGTPESAWVASGRVDELAQLGLGPWRRAVVVAPHPDDEVLGAGGLLRALALRGVDLHLVAVTDGEASHPGSVAATALDLRARRATERAGALNRLLPRPPALTRLGLPDGRVSDHPAVLYAALGATLEPGDLCIAPWWEDGHPDHNAAGAAARKVASANQCDFLGFLVWAWHWAKPQGTDLPWADCRRWTLSRRDAARKRWATSAFRSQVRPLGAAPEDRTVLPDPLLRHWWRNSEVFVTDSGASR